MATPLRFCSDEELQKAMTDLQELVKRSPILDECKSLGGGGGDGKEELKETTKKEKKKKKKLYRMHPDDVDMLLSFNCEDELKQFPKNEMINKMAEEDPENHGDTKVAVSIAQVLGRHYLDGIRATQEKMRYELLTKGYVTFEATDDEEEEEEAAAPARGRGDRRRHRPGVTKRAGGQVKKLN